MSGWLLFVTVSYLCEVLTGGGGGGTKIALFGGLYIKEPKPYYSVLCRFEQNYENYELLGR